MKILDMHCDTISELLDIRRKGDAARIKENTLRSNGLHIDLEKMKKQITCCRILLCLST